MRKNLLFLLLLILAISLCSNLFAQVDITIGDGTQVNTTTGAPAPYGTWYKSFRQQFIVLASELNNQGGGPGNITSLAFNVETLNNITPMNNFRIRLKHTTQTALTSTFEAGDYSVVFQQNDFTPTVGWNLHTFSIPFNWNGASNLLVEVVTDLITGNYAQNASVYYTSTTFASSLRYESDTVNAGNSSTGTTANMRSNMKFTMQQLDMQDMTAISISGNTTPSVGTLTNYIVRVKNLSPGAQSNYTVKLMAAPNTELLSLPGTALNAMAEADFTFGWTPETIGPMQLFGRVEMTGDENPANNNTPNLNLEVQPADILRVQIGTDTQVNGETGSPAPYGTWYKAFREQYLYRASEIYAAGGAPGLITSLAFNVQNVGQCTAMTNFKIRLKHTAQEVLTASFEGGEYETVFQAGTFMPVNGWNMHTLSSPFFWNGGDNLIIEVVTDLCAGAYARNALVYFSSPGFNSSVRFQSDSANGDTGSTGTVSANRSNVRLFLVVEDMGSLSGTVTTGGAPLAGATVSVDNTAFTFTTAADGTYTLPYVNAGAQTVTASKHGYASVSHDVTIVEGENTVQNFALNLLPQVTVSGRIVGSDAPTLGIADAVITLSGYEPYTATTNAQGQFTIEDVFASQTYQYVVAALGYQSATGQAVVGTTNLNMGDITVAEMAFPPYSVIADESTDFTEVLLSWQAPDPSAVDITEGFEGDFPPEGWSQIINNNNEGGVGVMATWCKTGTIGLTPEVPPHEGDYQAAIWWDYSHQDEWLITPEFVCPGNAALSFWSYVFLGSPNEDHYYIKASTDGGNTWQMLWDATEQTGEWNYYDTPIVVPLDALSGQQIKLAFHALDPPSNDGLWHVWFVDDVTIGNAQRTIKFPAGMLSSAHSAKPQQSIINSVSSKKLPASRAVYENPSLVEGSLHIVQPQNTERSLLGYKVWRFLSNQQDNEANWTLLTSNNITTTSYTDAVWGPLPSGVYKYAVKAIYTNNVASMPAFSAELHKGMMGVLTGTVTEFGTNLPIEGVTVTAGEYSGVTNAQGGYSFSVYAGNYTVTANKTGYQSASQPGVVIVGLQTTTQDFVLTEITLPPGTVQAEEADNNVNITWMTPGTSGGEWISYHTDSTGNSIGTGDAAEFEVAIRFPASSLSDYGGMSLRAVKVWTNETSCEYTLRVYTGGSPTAPGNLVSQQTFTHLQDAENLLILDTPVPITGNEELWFGYFCNTTTGHPAGCDAGPAIEGFGNMMYFNNAWGTLNDHGLDYNWMIEGYVGYSAPTRQSDWIALKAEKPFNPNRAHEGYKVWRLLQGQESNEAAWTALTPNPISATAFQDTGWASVPDGMYKWAVKAVYTGGALSASAFSNPVPKATQVGIIAGFVRNMQNQAVNGATVRVGNKTGTSNVSGAYSIQGVPQGTHSVTASHPYYDAVTIDNVVVVTGQTTTVNFQLPDSPIIMEDSFETYPDFSLTFDPWVLVDVDQSPTYGFQGITFPNTGSAMAYIIFNPSSTNPALTSVTPHTGQKMAATFAANPAPNNDWMISPAFTGGGQLKFWARTYMLDYGLERFKVGVSTGGTAPADFTFISGANYIEAPLEWTEYTYNLAAYANQDIRIAIQCVSDDAFIFFVDDVTIERADDIEDLVAPVYTTELKGNFPNPFNPETTIRYSVKDRGPVSIDIYNVKGQLVRSLINEVKEAGEFNAVWNGTDNNGRAVSSGVYYFKMNAGKYSSTKKMIMMK
ncbi:MAG: carboxypeptidase regulatory-like domain-containing protein [Candidatus Cloacimonetes bacterium]|nr:carboxypeptidase regulatory-like domain-containing protein [Candidatus Cloacimonadota bacterium]